MLELVNKNLTEKVIIYDLLDKESICCNKNTKNNKKSGCQEMKNIKAEMKMKLKRKKNLIQVNSISKKSIILNSYSERMYKIKQANIHCKNLLRINY